MTTEYRACRRQVVSPHEHPIAAQLGRQKFFAHSAYPFVRETQQTQCNLSETLRLMLGKRDKRDATGDQVHSAFMDTTGTKLQQE